MVLSVLVAKMLAIFYLSAGVAALGGKVNFGKIVGDFEKSSALIFITGFISIVVGMLLVTYHNIWVKDWTVLITIVGWAALVKGVLFIAFPGFISCFKGIYKNTRIWGVIIFIIGLMFGYFGFVL